MRNAAASSRQSLRLWIAIFTYSSLYRSLVQALVILRVRILAKSHLIAPSAIQKQPRQASGQHAQASSLKSQSLTHRARVYARTLRILRSDATLPLLASLLASPALVLLLPLEALPASSLGLWLISSVSSTAFLIARERKSKLVSWVPDWANSSLLYAIGNGQLLWAFLFETEAFPQGYGKLILARSSTYIAPRPTQLPSNVEWPSRQTISDHVALLATPTPTNKPFPSFTSPLLSAMKPSKHPTTPYHAINPILDYSPAHPAHTQLMCAMLHPTEPSCRQTLINHFKAEWLASARFAGAFALLSSVLFRSRSWVQDPETQIFKVAAATVQGASVISGSVGTSWAMICFLQQLLPPSVLPRSRFFLNGFLSSLLWIRVVPRERRRELGLYTGRTSLQSAWKVLEKRGHVKALPRGDVAIFALGLALLAGLYESQGDQVKGGPGAIAKRLFGDRMVSGIKGDAEDDDREQPSVKSRKR